MCVSVRARGRQTGAEPELAASETSGAASEDVSLGYEARVKQQPLLLVVALNETTFVNMRLNKHTTHTHTHTNKHTREAVPTP